MWWGVSCRSRLLWNPEQGKLPQGCMALRAVSMLG